MATIESKLTFQDEMSAKINKINTTLVKVTKTTEKARQNMDDMTMAFGAGSREANEATIIYAREKNKLDALNKTLEVTKQEQEEMARAERQAALEAAFQEQNTSLLSRGMDGLKNIFSGVAGRLAAGMKIVDMAVNAVISSINGMKQAISQSIQDYGKYQNSLTDINNLLDRSDLLYEQNKANLQAASKAAIRNGISIEDANTALFNSVSAIGDANTAIKTYESAQILAKAGATSLATATDGLTNVINAYGLSADEANDVSTAFFRAQVVGKTTVGEMAAAIGGVAPIAKSAGVSYKELLATMSVLTKGGLDTASATTALRATMTALIKPSKQAEEVLKQYGVPVGAAELQSKGLAYALVQLQKAAEANPDTMAEMIPNIRALTGVSTLTAESLELVQKTIADMNDDIANGSGMMEAYADKLNTLEAVQNRFKGANQDLALTIGSILEPIVKAFLTTLTNVINFINNAITIVMEFSDILKVVLGGAVIFLIFKFTTWDMVMKGITITAKVMWAAVGTPLTWIIGLATLAVAIFDKMFGITFKQNVQNAIASLHFIATLCSNLITLFQNAGIAFSNIFKKDGEKAAYKQFKDNSLYSNLDRAAATMKKVNLFQGGNIGKTGANPKVPDIKIPSGGNNGGGSGLDGLTTNTSGGKALKTQNQGDIGIKEEDMELLHDLATRDFMLNYQQLTPQITIPGMVIHETADVNQIFDAMASSVSELVDTSLSVSEGSLAV